jgi:hypothetical protein
MAEEETKGFFESLFSRGDDEKSPREREMVMSPPPSKPVVNRADYDSDLDYKLAKRKAEFEYRKLMEDREVNPENYLVPAAAAEADPTKEHGAFTRERDIEEAIRANE